MPAKLMLASLLIRGHQLVTKINKILILILISLHKSQKNRYVLILSVSEILTSLKYVGSDDNDIDAKEIQYVYNVDPTWI